MKRLIFPLRMNDGNDTLIECTWAVVHLDETLQGTLESAIAEIRAKAQSTRKTGLTSLLLFDDSAEPVERDIEFESHLDEFVSLAESAILPTRQQTADFRGFEVSANEFGTASPGIRFFALPKHSDREVFTPWLLLESFLTAMPAFEKKTAAVAPAWESPSSGSASHYLLTDEQVATLLALLKCEDIDDNDKIGDVLQALENQTRASAADIERASEEFGSDHLQIDDGALVSVADDAIWVSAWVRLENDESDGSHKDDDDAAIALSELAEIENRPGRS
jgi:hypothetical protein